MSEKEFTYAEVAEHKTKKVWSPAGMEGQALRAINWRTCVVCASGDVYVVVHDKVYNASTFVDEHPGGEEVLMDVAGQDATDAFEDVGHSDEAREILEGLHVGSLKRQEGDPKPSSANVNRATWDNKAQQSTTGLGVGLYLFLLVGGAAAYYGYQYLQQQQQKA